jgi:hypothetical protein
MARVNALQPNKPSRGRPKQPVTEGVGPLGVSHPRDPHGVTEQHPLRAWDGLCPAEGREYSPLSQPHGLGRVAAICPQVLVRQWGLVAQELCLEVPVDVDDDGAREGGGRYTAPSQRVYHARGRRGREGGGAKHPSDESSRHIWRIVSEELSRGSERLRLIVGSCLDRSLFGAVRRGLTETLSSSTYDSHLDAGEVVFREELGD